MYKYDLILTTPPFKTAKMPSHCMNMKAIYGFNKDLPGGVHSLFDENREAVVYPASHTLVVLDCYG